MNRERGAMLVIVLLESRGIGFAPIDADRL
jgi:hypothetical protein